MNDVNDTIAWHPGFVAAACMELKEESHLQMIDEYTIGKEPLRIDLYVQRDDTNTIKNEIGKIFRKYNVLEYKNPIDSLNIDDFFKTIGYACILKGLGAIVNQYPEDQITISLFRDTYPKELFSYLKNTGRKVKEKYKGIYYITGNTLFPAQVIVTKRLDRKHTSLRILSRNADKDDLIRFIMKAKSFTNPGDKLNADAILQVSISANRGLYDEIKEDEKMCKALEELMADVITERENEAAKKAAKEAAEIAKRKAEKIAITQARKMNMKGYPISEISDILGFSSEVITAWLQQTPVL